MRGAAHAFGVAVIAVGRVAVIKASEQPGDLTVRGFSLVGRIGVRRTVIPLHGAGRIAIVIRVGLLDLGTHRPDRYRGSQADKSACSAEGESIQVLYTQGIDLHVLFRGDLSA